MGVKKTAARMACGLSETVRDRRGGRGRNGEGKQKGELESQRLKKIERRVWCGGDRGKEWKEG